MIEALWSVEFRSNLDLIGSGIVVLETGRVFGGDSAMIYVGSYTVDGNNIKAELHIHRYASAPGMVSITGLDDYHLQATGKLGTKEILLQGHVVGAPNIQIVVKAVRRAELP